MATAAPNYIELTARYNGVYVFVAYVIAVVGATTTLELLLRRTGGSGRWNIMLMIGAGIAFGSTATWGMHFVGNQAITLHYPAPFVGNGIPLSYDVGFTILSLVVACLSMIIAFSFVGLRLDSKRTSHSEDGGEHNSEKDHHDRFQLDTHIDCPNEIDSKGPEDDPDKDAGSRFSWHPRKASLTPGQVINLPLPRRNTPAKQASRKSGDPEEDDDEGEFGTAPVPVSLGGLAKILGAGIICGGGVAAMHYVGQVSINSVPRVTNTAYMVFLSILIAMGAVTLGLFLLFVVLRPKLQHAWYKRLGVAMTLGAGTTAMHFVALLGTHFYVVEGETLIAGGASSKHLIIALVCVVAPVCCFALLAFTFVGQQRLLRQIAARHRIVLAVAIFDQQGLLLVRQDDGLLPSSKIYPNQNNTSSTSLLQFLGLRNRLSLEASSKKLSRSDPAFLAFIRTSWSWRDRRDGSVSTGTASLPADGPLSDDGGNSSSSRPVWNTIQQPVSKVSLADGTDEDDVRYSEDGGDGEMSGAAIEGLRRAVMGFEMASQEIATELTGTHNTKATGILYDNILKTGHFEVSSRSSGDKFTVTQGQMLILTRRLKTTAEREALLARGYTFAEPGAVARVTANAFAVPTDRVFDFFRDVHRFTRFGLNKRLDRGRLYGGVLIVQAQPGEGLQLVVDEKQHHSIPMVELATLIQNAGNRSSLPPSTLQSATLEGIIFAMRNVAGRSLLDLSAPSSDASHETAQLASILTNNLRPYLDRVLSPESMAFLLPRLVITPTLLPITSRPGPTFGPDGVATDAYLVCLKAVIPSSIVLPGPTLNWLPFSLYKAQSDCVTRASGQRKASVRPGGGDGLFPFTASPPISTAFPPSTNQRASVYSRASDRDEDDIAVAAGGSPLEEVSEADRPVGLPLFDPDYVQRLVTKNWEVSKPWNWELPTRELRKSGQP